MNIFEHYQPCVQLQQYIQHFHFINLSKEEIIPYQSGLRVFPSHFVSMVIFFSPTSYELISKSKNHLESAALTGYYSTFKQFYTDSGLDQMIVSFTPTGIQFLLDFSLEEISDNRISLKSVFPMEFDQLINELNLATGNSEKKQIFESFFIRKIIRKKNIDPRITPLFEYVLINKGCKKLSELSKETCLGERTIQRLIKQFAGINYKQFAKLVRFQYVQNLLNKGNMGLSQVAHTAHYFDQSHFIHDFQEFSGMSPKDYKKQKNEILWNKLIHDVT